MQQTFYATLSSMHTNLEQGHKNIITYMLCLGMYLGLLWCNHKAYR